MGLPDEFEWIFFQVTNQHFINGDMKLKCTATISTVYWKSNEESVQGSGFHPPRATASESRGLTSGINPVSLLTFKTVRMNN